MSNVYWESVQIFNVNRFYSVITTFNYFLLIKKIAKFFQI